MKARDNLIEKFERFHAANPLVYELFVKFAQEAIVLGRRKSFAASNVTDRIRWETNLATADEDGLKINDNFSAFYARMFMRDFPKHAGVFRTRRSVADLTYPLAA